MDTISRNGWYLLILVVTSIVLVFVLGAAEEGFETKNPDVPAFLKSLNESVDVYLQPGHSGTGVTHQGLIQLLKDSGTKHNLFRNAKRPPLKSKTLMVSGGGSYRDHLTVSIADITTILQKSAYKKLVILPSSFDTSQPQVKSFLLGLPANSTVFARDLTSLRGLKATGNCEALLSKDTSHYLNLSGYGDTGKGVLLAFRKNKAPSTMGEGFASKEGKLLDPSYAGPGSPEDWQNFLRALSKFDEIHTDRTHVAICAARMGKKTYVHPGTKAKDVANHSLSKMSNVRIIAGSGVDRLIAKYMGVGYVTSLSDKVSKKRYSRFVDKMKEAGLPIAHINHAFHYKRDRSKILSKYPYVDSKSKEFEMRPGAYGLTASFLQFLHYAVHNDFTMYYEDDSEPASNQDAFKRQLVQALSSLPKKGNDVYSFSATSYCEGCKNEPRWKERSRHMGTTALLFTKSGARAILAHIMKKGTDKPIDKILNILSKRGVIHGWDWGGNVIVENPMFCGLFKQHGVFCHKDRPDNLMGVSKY